MRTWVYVPLLFFSTDGSIPYWRMNTILPKEYHESESIDNEFPIPGASRFYEHIHSTFIRRLELKFPIKIDEIKIAYNQHKTTAYWGFKIIPTEQTND